MEKINKRLAEAIARLDGTIPDDLMPGAVPRAPFMDVVAKHLPYGKAIMYEGMTQLEEMRKKRI